MEQIAIFCDVDDFCKAYEEYCRNKLLMNKEEVVPRTRMSLSEIMTILIMYHLSGYKTFKWYYIKYVMVHQRKDFPDLLSYNRFVEIMKFALVPLILYTIKARFGKWASVHIGLGKKPDFRLVLQVRAEDIPRGNVNETVALCNFGCLRALACAGRAE